MGVGSEEWGWGVRSGGGDWGIRGNKTCSTLCCAVMTLDGAVSSQLSLLPVSSQLSLLLVSSQLSLLPVSSQLSLLLVSSQLSLLSVSSQLSLLPVSSQLSLLMVVLTVLFNSDANVDWGTRACA